MARKQFQDVFPDVITQSATIDFGSVADGNEEASDVTVAGAALGDIVLVSCGVDLADLQLSASVTAANTVTLVVSSSGDTVNLAETTYKIIVLSPNF
tara:strand:- start:868 stop:1158 length:291 start_codon:yes stop_codon:yes gene_type:complete